MKYEFLDYLLDTHDHCNGSLVFSIDMYSRSQRDKRHIRINKKIKRVIWLE